MSHNQQGFTLIEILVVLSLFTILLTLIFPISYSLLENKTEEKVLELFQYDILFLQNQSVANGREDYLRMVFSKDGYTITDTKNELFTRRLPEDWEIDTRTLNYISFKHNGTTRYSGTIEIISPNNRYTVTFPIGKGRGYIVKR